MARPFDTTGLTRGADGALRYEHLAGSLVDVLRRGVRERPDREAVVEIGGGRLTYAQLWDRAGRVAGGLRDRGVGRGDRVAVLLPNGLDWVLGYLGAVLAGAVVVPVNTRFAPAEVEYVVADSGAKLVIDGTSPLPAGSHHVVPAEPGDVVAIFYTSGTTGHPKGAMLTHEGVVANAENAVRFMALDLGVDGLVEFRTLIGVPLFHATGCHMQLVTSLYLAGTAVIMPRFDAAAFLTAVARERITLSVSAPAIYAMIMDVPGFAAADTSSLRALYYGGAPTTPAQVRRMRKAFPGVRVGNGFGLTEATGVLTLLPDGEAEDFTESVGYAMPCVEVRVDAPDPATGAGELLARGANLMVGYWNNAEATDATVVDGWLRTGDVARIDDDGRVYIVDRAKDMINRGGENVYSSEVENALAAVEGVGEVAVVAVPDPTMGERVGAVLVPRPDADLDPEEVIAEVRCAIADFKVPEYVMIRKAPLPRNAAGKVLKRNLRDLDWADAQWVRRRRGVLRP